MCILLALAFTVLLVVAGQLADAAFGGPKGAGNNNQKIYTPKDRKCGICESIADAILERSKAALRRGDPAVRLEGERTDTPSDSGSSLGIGRWVSPVLALLGIGKAEGLPAPPGRQFVVSNPEHARRTVSGICDEVAREHEGSAAKAVEELFSRSSQAGVGSLLDGESKKKLMSDLLKKSGRLREPPFSKEQCQQVLGEVKWGLVQIASDGGRLFYKKMTDDFGTDDQLQRILREAKSKNRTKQVEESIVDSTKDEKSSLADDRVDYSDLRRVLGSFDLSYRDACLPVCDFKRDLRAAVREYSKGLQNFTVVAPDRETWDFLRANAILLTGSGVAIICVAALVQWQIIVKYQRDTKAGHNRAAAQRLLLAKQQEALRARIRAQAAVVAENPPPEQAINDTVVEKS